MLTARVQPETRAGRPSAVASPARSLHVGSWLRLLPTGVLVGCAWALAWDTGGSIDAADWLPYAVGCALVLAVVLLAGTAARPGWTSLSAGGLLLGFACWTAVSLDWSPVPSLARDDALLVGFYVVAFAVPLATLRSAQERLAAAALVVAGIGSLALAGAVELAVADRPADLFWDGRMAFPITYPNALAALVLVAFWPAVGLAAHRLLPVLVRATALGSACAMAAVWLLAQSKGGAFALASSGLVFFAVCPWRLRALVPTAVVAAAVGAAARTLTEPYRAREAHVATAIRDGGRTAAVVVAVTVGVGLVYAWLDRRTEVGDRTRRLAGRLVLAAAVAAVAGGIAAFFVTVHRPGHFLAREWRSFKHLPTHDTASSHLLSLGSNRYDFWRVAWREFERHPLGGIGARGFGPAYLVSGRSAETPARAHSVEMDALSETGIVGFLLLVGAGGLGLLVLLRGARASLVGAGLLGSGVYLAAHTAVDWVWTVPEVGLVALALAGIGASVESRGFLPPRAALPAGVAALALALLAFAPPWLSARYVARAYEATGAQAVRDDLRWARRLDPLSVDPLVAEAELASPPADIPPLERAVAKEPRLEGLRYLLGAAYLRAGRKAEARRELRIALRLYPGDGLARQALGRAR
jgi:hypothetical protein